MGIPGAMHGRNSDYTMFEAWAVASRPWEGGRSIWEELILLHVTKDTTPGLGSGVIGFRGAIPRRQSQVAR
ncbi:hypothetical protein IMZ48_25215 [Candidatus Bathyarchaeota archaeon]|nr:hypothetical protein [Candidatus Bathyarchaeota archaeon]